MGDISIVDGEDLVHQAFLVIAPYKQLAHVGGCAGARFAGKIPCLDIAISFEKGV